MGLYDFTLYSMIKNNALTYGDDICWYEAKTGQSVSYREYLSFVDELAAGLSMRGIGIGDRIGAVGKNSFEFFVLFGAAAALGAEMLPVNWRLSAEEIRFNLEDGQAKTLFADQEFQGLLDGISIPSVKSRFNLIENSGAWESFYDLKGETACGFCPAEVSMNDGIVIIHTAAASGKPRGALISHGNIVHACTLFKHVLELNKGDVHLNLLPLFHVGGLFMAIASFYGGMLNVNMHRFDGLKAAELIADKKVGVLFDFAPILSSILNSAMENDINISSLKRVVGLESPEVIEQFQKITGGEFYTMFGQTETSCLATAGKYSERPGSAGRVIPMAEVMVVDEKDTPLKAGEKGEIVVRGPMVFKGYINLPEETAYTFRNGWHHTGDLGRFDEDGYLFYEGRKAEKELIKPGGENVYPAEVEQVVLEHPDVARVVVFGVPDPKWKEGIKAVCLLNPGAKVTPEDIIGFTGERIARYKKPGYVEFAESFPLSSDGSPDREKIKKLYGKV